MKMQSVCPYCEKLREIEIVNKREKNMIRGTEVEFDSVYSLCLSCRQDFATAEQMSVSLLNGYQVYRELHGIVSPLEIIAIRKKYGASQKAFAKVLDLGELTINSLEQGSLATKSISNLIRLMDKPENFSYLFEVNKSKLTPLQIRKIEAALAGKTVPLYLIDLDTMVEVKEKYTGYLRPDQNQYMAMLQLILHFAGKELYKMALLKIAFYCDFLAYKRFCRPITGWPYAAIKHGPVPQEYKTILSTAEEMGRVTSSPDEDEIGDLYSLCPGFSFTETRALFSEAEVKLIADVTGYLKNKTATKLRNLTHQEDAWKQTPGAGLIEYAHAEKLKLEIPE